MMDDTHIADGIAVKLLLAGIVLASGAVGVLGLAPVGPQATANGVDDTFADDHAPRLMFPINNVTRLSIDGVSRTSRLMFPINNVTLTGAAWDVKGADRLHGAEFVSTGVETQAFVRGQNPDGLPQDMEPY